VESRNVILPEADVRALIVAAYDIGPEFGLLIEVLAVTGARVSQVARLEVGDVQAARADPRLMKPSSRKGRSRKRVGRRPVPIPASLRARWEAGARCRAAILPAAAEGCSHT
jgi:integrase